MSTQFEDDLVTESFCTVAQALKPDDQRSHSVHSRTVAAKRINCQFLRELSASRRQWASTAYEGPKGETLERPRASISAQPSSSETYRVGCPSLRMRVSKRRLAVYSSLLLVVLTFLVVSRKYFWL